MRRTVSTDAAPAAAGADSQATETDPPARSAVGVDDLPGGVGVDERPGGVEVEAVATR